MSDLSGNSEDEREGGAETQERGQKAGEVSKKEVIDYLIAIPLEWETHLEKEIERIRNLCRLEGMELEKCSGIRPTAVCRLKSGDSLKKRNAIDELLRVLKGLEGEGDKTHSRDPFTILIPENMVSIVIGKKGSQIKQLQEKTRTEIFVSSSHFGQGTLRGTQVKGRDSDISDACRKIYDLIQDRAPYAQSKAVEMDREELSRVQTTQRVVLHSDCLEEMRKSNVLHQIEDEFQVRYAFDDDSHNPALRPYECSAAFTGALKDVQRAFRFLFERVDRYSADIRRPEQIKMLIPQQYVSKIIGVGGNMIKEIKAQSGGAEIKILSDKDKEKKMYETVISIGGTLSSKSLAAAIIAERIELFKHGDKFKQGEQEVMHGNVERLIPLREVLPPTIVGYQQSRTRKAARRYGPRSKSPSSRSEGRYSPRKRKSGSREWRRRSKSRSRIRSRSRSHSPLHSRRSRSRSHSRHRSRSRTAAAIPFMREGRMMTSRSPVYDVEETEDWKTSFNIIVPARLVRSIIGRNGELISSIAKRSGCVIFFDSQGSCGARTPEGELGELCTLKGSIDQITEGFRLISDTILRIQHRHYPPLPHK